MEPRLSIIIPVYNAEPYLRRCVASCLNQDFDANELEIILCNDGSTDSSLEIAEELATKDCRIKVFSQENAGAGMARNLGLLHARGTYVMFVDSDDYLMTNSVLNVLELCERNDLDLCKYVMKCIILESGTVKVRHSPIEINKLFTGDELLGNPIVPLDSACSSLYRRLFLDENELCFSNQTSSEDVAFNLRVYPHAKRIMYTDTQVYTYEVRTGSRRHSTDLTSRTRYLMNNMRNAAHVKNAATSNLITDTTKQSLLQRCNSMTIGNLIELWNARKVIPKSVASEVLELAKKLDLYPIEGRTFSWKTTLAGHLFLNHQSIFLSFFKQ